VISLSINHQTFEHTLHFGFDLIQQQGELARLDKVGNIIVCMKALARRF
jgi:hypothetical protein